MEPAILLLRLTPLDVVRDVPHDFPALVTYALLALFVGFVWLGNRRGSETHSSGSPRLK